MYEVIVGNIGMVFSGEKTEANRVEAYRTFNHYVEASKSECGRAGGETVTLFLDEEIIKEHIGSIETEYGSD